MLEKLNKDKQESVSGGNSLWRFDDGKILMHYSGTRANPESFVLYNSLDEANAAIRGVHPPLALGPTFTDRTARMDQFILDKRTELEDAMND